MEFLINICSKTNEKLTSEHEFITINLHTILLMNLICILTNKKNLYNRSY